MKIVAPGHPLRLLVVDDDEADGRLLEGLCRGAGLDIERLCQVKNLSEAVSAVTEEVVDLALLDLTLSNSLGVGTIQYLIDHSPTTAIVVVNGIEDEALHLEAIRSGAQDYLVREQLTPEKLRRALLVVMERQTIRMELRQGAFTDALTGLHNRRGFMAFATHQLAMAQRTGRPAIVIYLDVDGLKLINDTFGHSAGDRALKQVAERLRKHCRGSDVLARIGGDEFAVLAINETDPSGVTFVDRLRRGLQLPFDHARDAWNMALSFGVSRFDAARPILLNELLEAADAAMYQDKRLRAIPDRV